MVDRISRIMFKALEEHVRRVNRGFKELSGAITAWFSGNTEEVQKKVAIISQLEKEAAKLKKELLIEAAQAEASIHRTDYIRLILQMDEAAGYVGGAAVRLGFLDFQLKPNDKIVEKFKKLIDLFIKVGDILTNAIKFADENIQMALQYCEELDDIEEQMDSVYRDLEAHIYKRKDLDIRDGLQLRAIALHLE